MDSSEFVEKILHISEKPWSDYTEADYTLEQWHKACLIHQHTGPPTSKSECKLPVKTPNGALNRNGVHAAAAALAGARSPINATPEQKAKAASALRGYYSQLGETPPDSLKQDAMVVANILQHHGIKGMKWGVRRAELNHPAIAHIPKSTRKAAMKDAEEFTRAKLYYGEGAGVRRRLIKAKVESRKKHDKAYGQAFDHFVSRTNLAKRAAQARSQRKRTDRGKTLKKFGKKASRFTGQVLTTAALGQSDIDKTIDDILEHHGVKGMKWGVRRDRPSAVTVRDKGKKLKTSGGHGIPGHPDAVRARTSGQIAKKSGLKALSDNELRAYANRLQLEQNVHRLQYNEKPAAQKFVARVLGRSGDQAMSQATKQTTKKIGAAVAAKQAAKVAAVAVAA